MEACPDAVELEGLLSGALDETVSEAVARHIGGCASCQTSLDAMTSLSRPLVKSESFEVPSRDFLNRLKNEGPFSYKAIPTALPEIPGYEILEELGRGGVGTVYKAHQILVNRIVALKVLLAGDRVTREELARFRTESQSAGKLNHPGIVQVYEVGEWHPTPESAALPYLCLEFVGGGTLARLMNHMPQSAAFAAGMMFEISRAVQAAHEQGIIHRDLKPENVLIDPITGKPKVADFGLAKQLDLDSRQTRTGMILGTPSYMAPEQARGESHAMGPATDVHGLGAMLYELLTGRPPFLGPTPLDTLVLVANSDPIAPRQIQPSVPRDLETICLKCLAKEPKRRYANAGDVAADLERFLTGRPILARPIGPLGRLIKITRRNPLAASLSTLLATVILGSLFGLTYLYLDAEEQRKNSDEARQKTQDALAEARWATEQAKKTGEGVRAVSMFFQKNVLAAPRPKGEGSGVDISLKQAIDNAEGKIQQQFAGQPEIEAAIRDTLVNTYYSFAEYDKARVQAERVLSLRKSYMEADDLEVFSAQNNLALANLQTGRFPEAEQMLRETLAGREKKLGPDAAPTLASMNSLAGYLIFSGQLYEAAELLKKALAIQERGSATDTSATLTMRANLGSVLNQLDRFEEAEPLLRAVLREREKTLLPDHPETILSLSALGDLLRKTGRWDEAGEYLNRAVASSTKTFGPNATQTFRAKCTAIMLIGERDLGRAISEFQKLLDQTHSTLPARHPERLIAITDWVIFLLGHGRPAEAKALIDDVVSHRRAIHSADNPLLASAILLQAEAWLGIGKPAEAEVLGREVLAIREKKVTANHWSISSVRSFLGECLTDQKKYDQAEPLLLTSYESLRQAKDTPKARLAATKARLRKLYLAKDNPNEAAKW